MEQVRIGIIGAGRIAHIMSAAYSQIRECRLLAVNDIVRSAAERLGARFNIPLVYDDYRELLNSAEVDAVLVCVPTQLHEEVTLAAAQAGKHIFCQKPMALTVAQCERMTQAANRVAWCFRWGSCCDSLLHLEKSSSGWIVERSER